MLTTRPVDIRFRPTQFKASDIITECGISTIIFCLIDESPIIKIYINKTNAIASFFIYEQPSKILFDLKHIMSYDNLQSWVKSVHSEFDPTESSIMI
jgi:hypothetical protein